MHDQLWSWVLSIVGLIGFVLAGKKVWWCWYVNIFCQILWFTYATVTEQWGFFVGALGYSAVFIYNAVVWTQEHRQERRRMDAIIAHNPAFDTTFPAVQDYVTRDIADTMRMFSFKFDDAKFYENMRKVKLAASSLPPNPIARLDGLSYTEEICHGNEAEGILPECDISVIPHDHHTIIVPKEN